MSETSCPAEARAAAEALCGGGPVRLTLISDRRGSAVWKATAANRAVAIKAGTGEGAAITAREADATAALWGPARRLAHGRGTDTAWFIAPWYEGPSTWTALRSVRDGVAEPATARTPMVELCDAVARLHAADWVHADLQPDHALHIEHGVQLLDCSWSWKPGSFEPSPLFCGGFVHLLPPELASSVEAGHRPVAPSRPDEAYTLAAGLWWALTGVWPLDYAAAGIAPEKLNASEVRRVIAHRRLRLSEVTVWPQAQRELRAVLVAPPEKRLSAMELGRRLRAC
ncbi:hypothetical protein [Streptomyces longispororuber]|uniref:hypothetical protein n=1 Tax=Streptomyces longispororuber TaxID=68230 RepID=UPI0036FF3CB5